MGRKCLKIFLIGLLYLVGKGDLFSQQCYKISYDKNGNRISFMTTSCSPIARGVATNVEVEKENDSEEQEDVLVYPNPNNGIFRIEANENYSDAEIQIYDNKGILVKTCHLENGKEIDICSSPSGIYVLRIIKDDKVRNMIVVKL